MPKKPVKEREKSSIAMMKPGKEENRVKMCHGEASGGEKGRRSPGEMLISSFTFHMKHRLSFERRNLLICLFGFGWCCTVI